MPHLLKSMFKPTLLQFLPLVGARVQSICTTQCRLAVDKALLSKMRKQTGVPFINCKKALEKFDNDFEQAKKWLEEESQREGWVKATKLQTRPMSQGLVAILSDQRQATMIEVNCETDFVARNEKFIDLVKDLVKECDTHFKRQTQNKVTLTKDHLGPIMSSQDTTLGDMVALTVGSLGENMALRRAAFLRCDGDTLLSRYVHPSAGKTPPSLMLGKYGAIVETRQDTTMESPIPLTVLGAQICQHIVGMNPKSIGEYSPEDRRPLRAREDQKDSSSSSESDSDEVEMAANEEEDRLLHQEFLLDTTLLVGELLHLNGVTVDNFVRFACGEETEDDKE